MKTAITRVIAILLLLCTFPIALFSCTSDDPIFNRDETDGTQESEKPTDATEIGTETNEVIIPDAEGTITLFRNGAFVARVIRAELASENDKLAYNELKSDLKDKTGKSVLTETDFIAAGTEINNSSAILVGETAYEESKAVYATLKKGAAVAKIVNNKYVIAFSNIEALAKLYEKIKEKIANANAEEIVIDSTWNIEIAPPPAPNSIKLPNFNGKTLGSAIDLGQGSSLYIVSDATVQKYLDYKETLESLGFELYTSNSIAGNEYSTYITQKQIINVMYFKYYNEVRIIEDNRDVIELPALKDANVYTKTSEPSFTMMGISDAGYPGGMSFIFKLSDGTFFIIDGGMCANRTGSNQCKGDPSINRLFKTLAELADDPNNIVISGWLITHIHNDHAGAFIDLAEHPEYMSRITLKQVIYSQPADSDMTDGNQPFRLDWMPNALAKMNISKTVKAHPGQVFYFADLKLTVLGSHDLVKPDKITSHNNASVVSMVEFGGKKMLFLADSEKALNPKLDNIYGAALDADILQVAHHGYNNTNAGIVYEHVTPSIVLWPIQTSDWKSGDNVYNVSFNKSHFDKAGIAHYVGGAANTTFGDLTTWVPTRESWKPIAN
jgi:hypothetical protein